MGNVFEYTRKLFKMTMIQIVFVAMYEFLPVYSLVRRIKALRYKSK